MEPVYVGLDNLLSDEEGLQRAIQYVNEHPEEHKQMDYGWFSEEMSEH